MATVLITGGTGMIGTALSTLLLSKGYTVIILTRSPKTRTQNPKFLQASWDTKQQTMDASAIKQADYIINLAGANVGEKRWTAKRKKEIVDSRVDSAATLVKALKEIPNKVKAVVSASGIDWYPADPAIPNPKPFTEDVPAGDHFLGDVCVQWEAGIQPVTQLGKRLVILRTSPVVSKTGGFLDRFEKPIRFGVAPILSKGNQMMSWIHLDDMCRMYLYAIENENMSGVYNAVAPGAVANKTLVLEIAQLITGRFCLPFHVPAFILRMVIGEMSSSVLKSTTVSHEKISRTGFQFLFPSIEAALFDVEKK